MTDIQSLTPTELAVQASVVGMGVVFVALFVLYGSIELFRNLMAPKPVVPQGANSAASADVAVVTDDTLGADEFALTAAAAAVAIALEKRRRAPSRDIADQPQNPWRLSGRATAMLERTPHLASRRLPA